MNRCSLEPCTARFSLPPDARCVRASNRRDEMGNLEAFAISFAKLVQILEKVDIQKRST